MRLRKSIEKAKQQRMEMNKKTPVKEVSPGKMQGAVPEEPVSAQTWTSPVYSESTPVQLNIELLARNKCVSMLPDSSEAEYYKVLQTNIQQRAADKNWNTIMVTSAISDEGKTLTSINLAAAFAKEFNQTVLLVDCDLKRQNIHKYLGYLFDKGIVDYLVGDCTLKDLIVWPNIDKLTLISGGKTISNTAELLGSPKMKALVKEIKHRYEDRYVIFDVPPVLSGADALAFAPQVDCVIMVVEEGRTSIKDVKKALEMIPTEKFMGHVLNRRMLPIAGYYY